MLTVLGTQFGKGGTGLSDGTLAKAIAELQNQREVVLSGAAANANQAVAGIKTADTIVSAILFDAGVPSSLLAEASIPVDGQVKFSTTNTTGKKVVVRYLVKP